MAGFKRLFIANRGEVAVRVARSCDALGIVPVFGTSAVDDLSAHLNQRERVRLGPARSSESYLHMERVVQAAKQSACTALHPGWGFLSENARFAALCEQHGIRFIGPPPAVMALMGTKIPAKRAMQAAGLRVIEGSDGVLRDAEHARQVATEIGYPVLLKAQSGGGGRGMRIARSAAEVEQAYNEAEAESRAAFGDGRLYMERLLEGTRHVEIQLMCDRYGQAVHVGERDCSVQRKHQKLIEESPAPSLSDAEREATLAAAVRAARSIGYVGAGTMEFLLPQDGELRFMEMNTRLQVEHCVSEMRSEMDLVAEQIRVAAGEPLRRSQSQIELRGHSIECRINAEDPSQGFRPSPGTIRVWRLPLQDDEDVRVDTHVCEGYTVPPHYDSLLCKIIVHGADRNAACDKMLAALADFRCEGVATTKPLHQKIIASDRFRSGDYHTGSIADWEV